MAHLVSRRAQISYYVGRWLLVALSTIVPTLVTLSTQDHGTVKTATQATAIALSLLVAFIAAFLQVTQMGQRWRLFHQRQVDLEHAGWQLFAKRGEYADRDLNQRFAAFVDRVENIVLTYEHGYLSEIARLEEDEGGEAETASATSKIDPLR